MQLRATRLIAYGRGRSAWTPAQIPTALWLDANDTNTITLNGSTVSQWNDKSGNGRNAVQATAANQPGWGVGRNLLLWSEQFQQGAWQRFQVGVTVDAATAPNGTLTADKTTGSAAAGSHILYQVASIAAAAPHTFVIRAKAAEYQYVTLIGGVEVFGGASVRYSATVDLTTGAITKTASAGSPISPTASTKALSNGWWEITVSLSSASANTVLHGICPTPTATPTQDAFLNVQYTGDGTSGVLVWGAQVNPGTTADAYQKTDGAASPTTTGINGKPGVTFDGVNDFLSGAGSVLTGNSQATICCVFTTSQTTTQNPIMVGTTTATATSLAIGSTAAKYNFYSWGIGTEGTYTPVSSANTPILAVGSRSSTNINSLFINGNSGSSGNTGGINITSGYTLSFANASFPFYLAGLIAEIVVLPIEATTSTRQQLEGYLAWKWGGF